MSKMLRRKRVRYGGHDAACRRVDCVTEGMEVSTRVLALHMPSGHFRGKLWYAALPVYRVIVAHKHAHM
jgi:hypothetical protein